MLISSELEKNFSNDSCGFDQIMQLHGEVFRELEGRRTQRICINGNYYFIKQHFGVGWKEIFKNLSQGRLPILSAKNEWQAIQRLKSLNINVPEIVAYGCRGKNPAKLESFLITKELPVSDSLEDFCKEWGEKRPLFRTKLEIINEVAHIARTLHENGMNHRDFYICHFLLENSTNLKKKPANKTRTLSLIDLHRAQIRKRIPLRWRIKDLAGLYFSSKDIGLTQRDLFRFIKAYSAESLHNVFSNQKKCWQQVKDRGEKLYQKHGMNKKNYLSLLSQQVLRKARRSIPMPCQLALTDSTDILVCEELMRLVPGKRLVAFGTWGEKEVVAKLFYGSRKANQHIDRDKKGINALVQAGISTPTLYYQGSSTDKKIQVLIFEKIQHIENISSLAFAKAGPSEVAILNRIILELATQHVLGIFQKDMHLKNFLITSDRIYTLDGSDIEKKSQPLSKEISLDNLALFIAQLDIGAEKLQNELLQTYTKARVWIIKDTDSKFLAKSIRNWRKIRWYKFQKKIFRDCTAFVKFVSISALMMCDRNYKIATLQRFFARPDAIFLQPEAQLLKNGRSTTVIKTIIDGQEVVIKRYNVKNFWHGLRRCLRPTRAAKSWRLSQYLALMGIPTAKPIAFVEKRFLGFRGKSYFAMEPVSGMHIGNYFSQAHLSDDDKNQMIQKVVTLFENMAQLRLTHGDLKMTNILIRDGEPVLIDLDGMKEHRCPFGFSRKFQAELDRFLKNWENQPSIYQLFEKGLHYASLKKPGAFSPTMLHQRSMD